MNGALPPCRSTYLVVALLLSLTVATCGQSPSLTPGFGGGKAWLVPSSELPLSTKGRYIIGKGGERVKWSCTNWYGAYSETTVPGGLEVLPMHEIAARIHDLGFNCVRMCYSTQAQYQNNVVDDSFVAANPWFKGKRFYDIWDAAIANLTSLGLMVIINNQVHKNGWCCHWTQEEGLWYVQNYTEDVWISSLVNMTLRYKNNPFVVGIDLRNEVHDWQNTRLTWGDGNPQTDWALAATKAGNAVLAANPNVLIVVMALCFGFELRPARDYPIQLIVPNRVVYQTHNYLEYQPWELISSTFASWSSIGGVSAAVGILAACCIVVIFLLWKALHKPRPPALVSFATFMAWTAACSMIALIMCELLIMVMRSVPGCNYWASRDVFPVRNAAAVIFALSCVTALCTGFFPRHARQLLLLVAAFCGRHFRCCCCARQVKMMMKTSEEGGEDDVQDVETVKSTDVEEFPPTPEDTPAAAAEINGDLQHAGRDIEDAALSSGSSEEVCCRRGCRSLGLGQSRARVYIKTGFLPDDIPPAWDCGLCCGCQCLVLCVLIINVAIALILFSIFCQTYWLSEQHWDRSWGFVLEDNRPYTAPVWMGEFGGSVPGRYWNHLLQYMSERDMDFGYWAINGLKYTTGWIDTTRGVWVPVTAQWTNETFGVLHSDYFTIRSVWRYLDLQSLMPSPPIWKPRNQPCDRNAYPPSEGGSCGG